MTKTNALEARLAEVKKSRPSTPATTVGKRVQESERWDERVRRATFYIDNELLEELDGHCRNNGLNKSEFVRDAIRNQLRQPLTVDR